MLNLLKRFFLSPRPIAPESPSRARLGMSSEWLDHPIYAISDIHGCFDLLLEAEAKVKNDIDRTGSPGLMIMLGDYIDRGPDSRQVIEHIMHDEKNAHFQRIALCGNHEEMALSALEEWEAFNLWIATGGDATLLSYGVKLQQVSFHAKVPPPSFLPQNHIDYLSQLPVAAQIGEFLFVHAGIRPGIALVHQRDSDMMWIREPFLTRGPALDLTVVHGHTPNTRPDFGPNRIGIDTGCWATGQLCVLKLSRGAVSILGADCA